MTTARKLGLMLKVATALAILNLAMAAFNLLLWQDYCARKDTAFSTKVRVDKLEAMDRGRAGDIQQIIQALMQHQHVQQQPKPNS